MNSFKSFLKKIFGEIFTQIVKLTLFTYLLVFFAFFTGMLPGWTYWDSKKEEQCHSLLPVCLDQIIHAFNALTFNDANEKPGGGALFKPDE